MLGDGVEEISGVPAGEQHGATRAAAIVLAAGKSTRMRSKTPKALHAVCGRELLSHILDALSGAGVAKRIVVIGHQAEVVKSAMDSRYGVGELVYAEQREQRGTGHAALMAEPELSGYTGVVLIVPGDAPLLTASVLKTLINEHAATGASATLLTAILPADAGSYGRVVREADGTVARIVEARDATPEELSLREINTSVYAFDAPALFRCLRDLKPENAQGELYLTDVIAMLRSGGAIVQAVVAPDADVVLGVNTRVELAEVAGIMRLRLLTDLMLSGVTVEDPATTYVEAGVKVGQDTTLLPFTRLLCGSEIGEDCILGPNTEITRSKIGNQVRARACFIEDATVGDGCRIGPFANLRPGTSIARHVKIGNFVELKNAHIAEGVSAGHLTYLGDAEVGAGTNIGAGTITCNYDGLRKNRTIIGEGVFVGSQTAFVAPITVGDGAVTAAGSIITEDVPAQALAVARGRQVNKPDWALNRSSQRPDKSPRREGR